MKVQEAHALATEMFAQHGITDWKIRWNRKPGDSGTTSYRSKTVTFSALAFERYSDKDVIQIIKHEIAHVLVGPGHDHGKVWKKKIKELGGEPAEFCPVFSNGTDRVLADILTPNGFYYVLLGVVATWYAAPDLAPLVTGGAVFWFARMAIKNSRVLPARERRRIEQDVLNP